MKPDKNGYSKWCTKCDKCLTTWYFEKDGKLYCKKDYWDIYGEACNRCGLVITGPVMVAGEHRYHPECFQCISCRSYIGDGDAYGLVERSKLFCGRCYKKAKNQESDSRPSENKHSIQLLDIPATPDKKRGLDYTLEKRLSQYSQSVRDSLQFNPQLTITDLDLSPELDTLSVGDRILEVNGISVKDNSIEMVRNAISKDYHGNQFVIFDDIPLFWDAWDVMDYHLETRKPINEKLQHVKILDEGPLRASLEFSLKISDKSYIKQVISLDAESPYIRFDTEVTWHENRKFLKVEFPTSIHSMQASYDIQYGHLQRTNHNNTSWDSAQFEVCGHKWADISEHGYGLALMNDCKYGYSCFDNVLRLSLLRSPKAPDETADMGVHQFTYAVMPHKGSFQEAGVIQQAYDLNCPLFTTEVQGEVSSTSHSYFKVDNSQIILETVKMCEDQTKDKTVVLRLYESHGGKGKAVLTSSLPVKTAKRCNALEEIIEDTHKSVAGIEGDIHLTFQPFEIISIMVEFNL
ncbi:alpha-mannosidase [Mytilus galloprovincialis]|uniref:Alpha-mannosidase n=1 Tax=Mytilus galloprovincialis TaxID=29158 RepID=A0A8B6DE99_MYTGA|nr:alpha-mannosidase [Mytilus galloprovincialis]